MSAYNILFFILKTLGALGLFLFGMKLMSESLQKVAGIKIRNIVYTMTANRFKAVFSGLIITAIVQSSSASTVMLVSFVNAGLLSLAESLGVMMGANIGTTIKIWFITILGVKFNINILLLPLIGLSLPLLFSKYGIRKSWGEFIMGFSLLFMGIGYLFQMFPENQGNHFILEFLHRYTEYKLLSIFIFVFAGIILTAILQSSSATITITIIMSLNGLLSFELAAAMVLGENIGTTVTANIASIVANDNAKKTALSHTFFNILGVIWALILFTPFLYLIDIVVIKFWGESPFLNNKMIPIALCFFHSAFNIINTLLWIGLVPALVSILNFIIPEKKIKGKYKLKNINTGLVSTSEFSIKLVQNELVEYAKMNIAIFNLIPQLLIEKDEKNYLKLMSKISKRKVQSDKKGKEIINFINSISEGDLSKKGINQINSIIKITDDIESIGDSCLKMVFMIDDKNNQKIWFTQNIRDRLNEMFNIINQSFDNMIKNLDINFSSVSSVAAFEYENKINNLRNKMKIENIEDFKNNVYSYQTSTIYHTIFSYCERIGDYIISITETIISTKE
jgi:phosphate:Na+ symporter